MYKSPLTEICENIANQITKQREDSLVYEIRQTVGCNIDKEELIKALQYDRNQYQKGYADALSVIDDIKADFISQYPKNVYGDLELGGRSCVFSLNKVLEIIDKNVGGN